MGSKLPFLRSIAVIALVLHFAEAKINLDFLKRMPQPSDEELLAAREAMTVMCLRNYGEGANVDPSDMISQICSGLLASNEYK